MAGLLSSKQLASSSGWSKRSQGRGVPKTSCVASARLSSSGGAGSSRAAFGVLSNVSARSCGYGQLPLLGLRHAL